jgi:hypothetical protein
LVVGLLLSMGLLILFFMSEVLPISTHLTPLFNIWGFNHYRYFNPKKKSIEKFIISSLVIWIYVMFQRQCVTQEFDDWLINYVKVMWSWFHLGTQWCMYTYYYPWNWKWWTINHPPPNHDLKVMDNNSTKGMLLWSRGGGPLSFCTYESYGGLWGHIQVVG